MKRKTCLQELLVIAEKELDAKEEIDLVYQVSEEAMELRWGFVGSTRRQYIDDIKRILANQYVLNV